MLGRYTAKRLLTSTGRTWVNAPYQSLEILNETEGAPYLNDPDCMGSLSISHRDGVAAAAFCHSNEQKVGIDLELIERRAWSFVEDFFTLEEAQFAESLPEAYRTVAITLIWSAKEAVLKAWKKGLRLDTRMVEILPPKRDEIDSLTSTWIRMRAKVHDPDLPPCSIFGRILGDSVLTLACTQTQPGKDTARIELIRL